MLKTRCLGYNTGFLLKLVHRYTAVIEVPEDFNFSLTAAAYNFSWFYDGSVLRLPLSRDGSVFAIIREVEYRKLEAKIYCAEDRDCSRDEAVERIIDVLGVEEKLDDFYRRCELDPILKDPPRGLHMRKADSWTAFLIAVSQQNASFKQGWYMLYRLYKTYGEQVLIDNRIVLLPPSPEKLLRLGESALRNCGYGYRAPIVMEVARRIVEQQTDDLHRVLKGVKGVGPYTYGLACAIAYREYDNPVIDRWVQGLYQTVGIRDVKKHYERVWGPWKAFATWMLTIVLDAVPLSQAIERVKQGLVKPTFRGLTPLTMWKHW